MKIALLVVSVCACLWAGGAGASPIDPKKQLVNRPRIDQFGAREPRSSPAGVKGTGHSRRQGVLAPPSLESQVTKGHYVCGDKICKLETGVEPEGCNGMCQYPIH